MIQLSNKGKMSAVDAKSMAQYIAFSPYIFQATVALKDLGILQYIDDNRRVGVSLEQICEAIDVSAYGISVLLDFALSCGLVECENELYGLTKVSFFLLHDEMSTVNMDFTQHFAYRGLENLTESIQNGKPEGLKVFGDWPTLYPHLSELPERTRQSWFAFDHFYSDHAFDKILPLVFNNRPKHIVDIGGNTGRFALKCLNHDENVMVTIMDLPPQLEKAEKNIAEHGFSDRFAAFPCDMLNPEQQLAKNVDVFWMSQFLDCFSEPQIKTILSNIARDIDATQQVIILETLWDIQRFDAAAFSLNATSLYFSCFANGNSRMYSAGKFTALVEESGLVIEQQVDDIGLGHSLLVCRKAS